MQKAEKLMELTAIYKEIKPQIDELKEDLLKVMQETDVESLKTGKYVLYRAKRVTPSVTDTKALKNALQERKIPFEMVEAFAPFMSTVFKNLIDQGEELDKKKKKITEYVSIRTK